MSTNLRMYLREMDLNQPANIDIIKHAEAVLQVSFPEEYLDFMLEHNGAEGKIGNSYLVIWPVEELIPSHEGYAVDEFAPGLILFGSDGGDIAYAFDNRQRDIKIVEVPFIGMDLEEVKKCADNFDSFIEYIYLYG